MLEIKGVTRRGKGKRMELEFLHMLQGWHNDVLNAIMVFITTLGNGGMLWIALGLVLAIIPKTRKCGILVLISMAFSFLLGNLILKNLIARPRPFHVDDSVTLLIPKPGEYSFPSGHTLNSFTASVMIFLHYKKPGIAALVVAALIGFSRMYLFVHYPTDILGGIVLGIFDAVLVYMVAKKVMAKKTPAEN